MITDEEIEQLPEDPELAFIQFERILRERTREKVQTIPEDQWQHATDPYFLEYITRVLAAAEEYEIESLKDSEIPPWEANFYVAYQKLIAKIDYFSTRVRLRNGKRNHRYSVGLDGNTKTKIHSYIEKIRIVLNKIEIPEPKRDTLFGKLDAFALEVDKSRTNLQAVTDIYLTVCTVIGEGFNKLEPVRRFIDSIAALMGRAKESEDSLLALPSPTKQLPFSLKQLAPPEANGRPLDDEEIPF
jgi:hypothetical protein